MFEVRWRHWIAEIPNEGIWRKVRKSVLRILSWGFQSAVFGRNWAYDRGLFRTVKAPTLPILSIGNITVGGTGKTPVALLIAKSIGQKFPFAILCRAYKSEIEKTRKSLLLCNGAGPLYPPSICGDEPYLIAQKFPHAQVWVGRDRSQMARFAAEAGARLIILDDGLQHRRLPRNWDIIVVDACDPFGGGAFLPRGRLRDSIHFLSRASLIIANHIKDLSHYRNLQKQLSHYTEAPIVGTRMTVDEVFSLKGKRVGLFCGIGQPERFFDWAYQNGANIVYQRFFPDHHLFNRKELLDIGRHSLEKGAESLLCTEKDAVKISTELPLPLMWPKMALSIVAGQEHWDTFLAHVMC